MQPYTSINNVSDDYDDVTDTPQQMFPLQELEKHTFGVKSVIVFEMVRACTVTCHAVVFVSIVVVVVVVIILCYYLL